MEKSKLKLNPHKKSNGDFWPFVSLERLLNKQLPPLKVQNNNNNSDAGPSPKVKSGRRKRKSSESDTGSGSDVRMTKPKPFTSEQIQRWKKEAQERYLCIHLTKLKIPEKAKRPNELQFTKRRAPSITSDNSDSGLGTSAGSSPASDISSSSDWEFPAQNHKEPRPFASRIQEDAIPSTSQSAAILAKPKSKSKPRIKKKNQKQTSPRRGDKILTALGLEPTKKNGRSRPCKKKSNQNEGSSSKRPRISEEEEEQVPVYATPIEIKAAEIARLKLLLSDQHRIICNLNVDKKHLREASENKNKELETALTALKEKSDEMNALNEKIQSLQKMLDYQDSLIRKAELTPEQFEKVEKEYRKVAHGNGLFVSDKIDATKFLNFIESRAKWAKIN